MNKRKYSGKLANIGLERLSKEDYDLFSFIYKEAQEEILIKLFEKGAYTTEEYINVINQELKDL